MRRYTLRHLVWSGMLMLLSGARSRLQHMSETLADGFLENLHRLADCAEDTAAHPDTINYLLTHLHPSELLEFNAGLAGRLLRMRCLEKLRFGREWLVAVDGTHIRHYPTRHCPRCLTQKQPDGSVLYFHAVLEAKLILANGLTVSLGSMAILNPRGRYDKQDCEMKAFTRLAAWLKQRFPRLPMCLLMDSLYGCRPVMKLCREKGWSYIIVFKKGRAPALWRKAVRAAEAAPANRKTVHRRGGIVQHYQWATDLDYRQETVHAVFCREHRPGTKPTQWAWITDHRPDRENVDRLANKGGRLRWKIENEGFNVQKNGESGLKHDYGSCGHVWYNYYLMAQAAELLRQLVWRSDLIRRLTGGARRSARRLFRTLRNFAARLRAALQAGRLPDGDPVDPTHIQIRLETS
ncbi:MAG: hypothetical protein BWZ02_03005 [Lentisphaerae bacterium ADurb.BinA184]|nr:MAG: hypothetical protein BWZ02_03005 [Lentisphaerae bacterium ADurb.BinA184]